MIISLNDLPNEILLHIFKLADSDKSLSLVCHQFYHLIVFKNNKPERPLKITDDRMVSFLNFIFICSALKQKCFLTSTDQLEL
jgi:hypothetical protein